MFRFSIRDVLWLTVVVGLVVGWWTDRNQVWHDGEHNRQFLAELKAVGIDEKFFQPATGRSQVSHQYPRAAGGFPIGPTRFGSPVPMLDQAAANRDIELAKSRSAELGAPQPIP